MLRALGSPDHPLLVHLIVTRRCNLSCTYCNEYDHVSEPVPLDTMRRRIKALADLQTSFVTCTGGEPLLHPELPAIIRAIRNHGMIPTLITNGYRLTKASIEQLNDAGLHELQISIDNVLPDDVSYKSLKVLDKKLQLLAAHAQFIVNVNSVLGLSDERARDAVEVATRTLELGFTHSIGVLHDEDGVLEKLSLTQRAAYDEMRGLGWNPATLFNYWTFQRHLMDGRENVWRCRAGARYLYICEDGLVHWCSQQRGYPGIPVEEYGIEDIRREYRTKKDCSPHCTVACVHAASFFDRWRGRQTLPAPSAKTLVQLRPAK
jgi:MoaA/NifB/PqqE/SkfB family radical SAM enzyme